MNSSLKIGPWWAALALLIAALVVALSPTGAALAGEPIGLPFPVADLDVPTANPAVACNTLSHEYLVVWYNDRPGNDDIYAQLVSKDGKPIGPRRALAAGPGFERRYPDVAYNPNSNEYLVVWEQYDQSSGSNTILGQRVLSAGEPVDVPIFISSGGTQSGWKPRVDYAFAAGSYLVVWQNHTSGNISGDIFAQRLSNTGAYVGGAFVIALGSWQFSHSVPDVAYDRRMNEFLVVWQQEDKNASLYDVFARIVRPDATMPPNTIEIARYTVSSTRPAVGAIPTVGAHGQYLVTWEFQYGPGNKDIMAHLVNGDATLTGSPFYLISLPNDQFEPAVAGNERSQRYLVTWTEEVAWSDIHAREVTAAGTMPDEAKILAGESARRSAVTAGPTGDFLLAYDDQPTTPNRDIWGYLWGNRVYLPLALRGHR